MNINRPSQRTQLTSKFVVTYAKLFQGLSPKQISPHEDPEQFFSTLLDLDVKREYLEGKLNQATKDSCLRGLKVCSSEMLYDVGQFTGCTVALSKCTISVMCDPRTYHET